MKIDDNKTTGVMPGRRAGRKVERNSVSSAVNEAENLEEKAGTALRSMPGRRTARRVDRRTVEEAGENRRVTSVRRRENRKEEMPAVPETEIKEQVPKIVEKAEAKAEPKTEAKTDTKPETKVMPAPEAKAESEPKTEPEISAEEISSEDEPKKAPKKKSSALSGKAIAILAAIAVVAAAIVFGIFFLCGKEKKDDKNFMDQLRTQEITVCEIEPVNQFFNDYYTYLSAGNTTEMEKMFDNPEKASVSAGVSTIVEKYSDLQTYITKGIKENEYAVFVCNNVKFNNINTTAPSVDCFYITYSPESGSVKIDTKMYTDPDVVRFLTLVSYMEPIRSKLKETDEALNLALNSDKELKNLYIVMQSMTDAVLSNETIE